jgi:ribosomal protein S18 acetylase RimI-like enzyme
VFHRNVTITRDQLSPRRYDQTLTALRGWQHDGAPMQLHPGDLGWHWRFGDVAVEAAVCTWSRGETILAVGLLDSPSVLRLALAPTHLFDQELAERMVADVSEPDRGLLPPGPVSIEARFVGQFSELLLANGWERGDSWTPLECDLAIYAEECGLLVQEVTPDLTSERSAVQRAAFDRSTFSDERWREMASGLAYRDARCLLAYNNDGVAVAAATVWSAGEGKPGILEPVGVHRDHRGKGYGRAITVAAASALRTLGASRATVCTESTNVGAVATYRSAGFQQLPDAPDLSRPA